jgi:2-C-methyl-D-erythritol 4-phosphate cytidylyltransferase
MKDKQKYVIIVAGGSGKRMGSELPKQFIPLGGKPLLMHTIERFYTYDTNLKITVVLPESQHVYWQKQCVELNFTIPHALCKGGVERFYSVKNGLNSIAGEGLVAIHDGVRPLVSFATIARCFEKANESSAAIPVVPATESIRKVKGEVNKAVNRNHYFMVQTPQVFSVDLLKKAYQQDYDCTFTDDASVVERLNQTISLVEGNVENIKITRPFDLLIAEALLND